MRQAVLTCDRCGHSLTIDANSRADGWRMIMSPEGAVAADLCPDCDATLMAGVTVPDTPPPA